MIKPDRNDHAGMVEHVRKFRASISAGEYGKRHDPEPLSPAQVARDATVARDYSSFRVIPAECMEAWGRGNRW